MQKIPFDIKYRPEIESGKYKVETNAGRPVRIICWDAKSEDPLVQLPIVGLIDYGKREMVFTWDIRGIYGNNDMDLIIVTDWKGLDDVKQRLVTTLSAMNVGELYTEAEINEMAEEETKALCEIFKEVLRPQPHWEPSEEQPEVDLEKEIKRWHVLGEMTDIEFDGYDDADIERTARHFYELGRLSQTK